MSSLFSFSQMHGGVPGFRRFATRVVAIAGMALFGGVLLSTSGCGSGSSSTNYQTTTISANIDWPARSRDIGAPASALSCIISLQSGNTTTGGSVDFPAIDRDTNSADAYVQAWIAPAQVRTGTTKINIRFYAQPDGNGSVVGDLTQSVNISSSQPNIGTFTVGSKVASLVIPSGQTVNFGSTSTVGFQAYDSTGALIAGISTGSAFFTTTQSGGVTVTQGGAMTGTLLGPTAITAQVDGITSTAANVTSIVGTSSLTATADGLQYRDTVIGTGTAAANGQTATVAYRLYLSTDGNLDSGNYKQVDPSDGSEGTFPFVIGGGGVISGFNEGVSGMAVGGTRILVIPPALGYGSQDIKNNSGNVIIPANSTLIFIVRLTGVSGG